MKRSPIKRKTPLRRGTSTLKRTPLRRISKRGRARSLQYKVSREVYLHEHPKCEIVGCQNKASEIHHKKFRGKFYLDVGSWMAICPHHHRIVHDSPKWAKDNGYILARK